MISREYKAAMEFIRFALDCLWSNGSLAYDPNAVQDTTDIDSHNSYM